MFSDSLLHAACDLGNLQVVNILLKHGANPCALNSSGNTPLWLAVCQGHLEVVKILLQYYIKSSSCSEQRFVLTTKTVAHLARNKNASTRDNWSTSQGTCENDWVMKTVSGFVWTFFMQKLISMSVSEWIVLWTSRKKNTPSNLKAFIVSQKMINLILLLSLVCMKSG